MALVRQQKANEDPELVRSLKGHEDLINKISFNPNMKQIGSVDKSGIVHIYDFRADMRPYKYQFTQEKSDKQQQQKSYQQYDILFMKSKDYILTCGEDKRIRIIKNKVNPQIKDIKEIINSAQIRGIALTGQEDILISYGDDKIIKLWDMKKYKFLKTLKGHTNTIKSSTISEDGRIIVSGSYDKSIRMWDVTSGENISILKNHNGIVNQVLFSNNLIFSCSDDCSIKVQDSRTKGIVQVYQGDSGVNSVSYSQVDNRIVSGETSGIVRIWDVRQGILDYTLQGHSASVNTVLYSYDNNYIATAGNDSQILIWKNNSQHQQLFLESQQQQSKTASSSTKINITQNKINQNQNKNEINNDNLNKNFDADNYDQSIEQHAIKIKRVVDYIEEISNRFLKLNSKQIENEKQIEYLINTPILSDTINQNLVDKVQFEQQTFKSVWEQFHSLSNNQLSLLSFNLHQQTINKTNKNYQNQDNDNHINLDNLNNIQVKNDFSEDEQSKEKIFQNQQSQQQQEEIEQQQKQDVDEDQDQYQLFQQKQQGYQISNPFQQQCLADSSGQILSDLQQTKTQKQLNFLVESQNKQEYYNSAFNQTFNE